MAPALCGRWRALPFIPLSAARFLYFFSEQYLYKLKQQLTKSLLVFDSPLHAFILQRMIVVQQVPLNNAGGQPATSTSVDFSPGGSVHSTRPRRLSAGHKLPLPSGGRLGHGSGHRLGRSHRTEGHYSKVHGFLGVPQTTAFSIHSQMEDVIS